MIWRIVRIYLIAGGISFLIALAGTMIYALIHA